MYAAARALPPGAASLCSLAASSCPSLPRAVRATPLFAALSAGAAAGRAGPLPAGEEATCVLLLVLAKAFPADAVGRALPRSEGAGLLEVGGELGKEVGLAAEMLRRMMGREGGDCCEEMGCEPADEK
ncbi:hypothetical protein TeGR_g3873 [Tetraparma gracilis]|uniref:Uncharacterized protein n=1 Tax=Tetraparma gracilis TaxID=2962635 RepID=A0ABQ6MUE4_9STRA|nr:hypothetical protein TeGR_g3873 [Tetraparma gracilis]